MSTKHRKSGLGRSRDLGIPNANGKGSADRVTDTAAYAANYESINWGPKVDGFSGLNIAPEASIEDFESWDR